MRGVELQALQELAQLGEGPEVLQRNDGARLSLASLKFAADGDGDDVVVTPEESLGWRPGGEKLADAAPAESEASGDLSLGHAFAQQLRMRDASFESVAA